MANTYSELTKQIAKLTAQAEAARQREVEGVISRIKEAIAAYGITASDLGFGVGNTSAQRAAKGAAKRAATSAPAKARRRAQVPVDEAKYRDGNGNTWGGRGPRPRWLRDAIAAGQPLESFAVGGDAPTAAAPAEDGKTTDGAAVAAKYKDDAGNSWSGRGPKPGWFKAALAAGKRPEDLAA